MPQDVKIVPLEVLFGRKSVPARDPHRARPGEERTATVKDGPGSGIKIVEFERVKKNVRAPSVKRSIFRKLKIKAPIKKTVTKTVLPKKPSVTKAISKEQPQQQQPLTLEERIARAKEILKRANETTVVVKRSEAQQQRLPASRVSPLEYLLPKSKPERFWDLPRHAEEVVIPYVPEILKIAGYSQWHLRIESDFSFGPSDFSVGKEFDQYGTNRHLFI
jgi:hypothetical protein